MAHLFNHPTPSVYPSIYHPPSFSLSPSLSLSLFPAPSPYLSGVRFHITAARLLVHSETRYLVEKEDTGAGAG